MEGSGRKRSAEPLYRVSKRLKTTESWQPHTQPHTQPGTEQRLVAERFPEIVDTQDRLTQHSPKAVVTPTHASSNESPVEDVSSHLWAELLHCCDLSGIRRNKALRMMFAKGACMPLLALLDRMCSVYGIPREHFLTVAELQWALQRYSTRGKGTEPCTQAGVSASELFGGDSGSQLAHDRPEEPILAEYIDLLCKMVVCVGPSTHRDSSTDAPTHLYWPSSAYWSSDGTESDVSVSAPHTLPPPPATIPLSQSCALSELINQAVLVALRNAASSSQLVSEGASICAIPNVIAFGHQMQRSHHPRHHQQRSAFARCNHPAESPRASLLLNAVASVECFYPNTTLNELRGPAFEQLAARAGDRIIIYLLLGTCLLKPLANGCFLQVSGPSVAHLQRVKQSNLPLYVPLWWLHCTIPGAQRKAKKDRTGLRCAGKATKQSNTDKEKKKKLSHRQRRRKHKRENKAAFTQAMSDTGNMSLRTNLVTQSDGGRERDPLTQPLDVRSPISATRLRRKKRRRMKGKPKTSGDGSRAVKASLVDMIAEPPRCIPRNVIFYSNPHLQPPSNKGLPSSHVLNHLDPTVENANLLSRAIFVSPCDESSLLQSSIPAAGSPASLPPRLQRLVPFVQRVMKRYQATPFLAVLHTKCAVNPETLEVIRETKRRLRATSGALPSKSLYRSLISSFSSYRQVTSFVCAICNRVLPPNCWGSRENVAVFRRSVGLYVRRTRHEKIGIVELCEGFKLRSMSWLHRGTGGIDCAEEAMVVNMLFKRWMFWLFACFISPILRAYFYCTETAVHQNRVFYYRKNVWSLIVQVATREFKANMLEPLSHKEAKRILERRSFSYSFVRLVPKSSGLRPIINLSRQPRIGGWPQPSVNQVLGNAFCVFTREKDDRPHCFGASVLSAGEIYERFLTFRKAWARGGRMTRSGEREVRVGADPVYLVTVDIQKCFDRIQQKKLYQVLEGFLRRKETMIHRYIEVGTHQGRVSSRYRKVASAELFPQFAESAETYAKQTKRAIFVDQVVYPTLERSHMLSLLYEHIHNNLIKDGNRFYRQTTGIAQGSVVSSLLCSLHIGHFESCHIRSSIPSSLPTEAGENTDGSIHGSLGVLIRIVDDSLYISTSQEAAEWYVKKMEQGSPEYGSSCNPEKTRVSFDCDLNGRRLKKCLPDPLGRVLLPWCGLLIDCSTLEVYADYLRFAGNYVRDSMTISYDCVPGKKFRLKIIQAVRPKCRKILLDSQINSPFVVFVNLYQMLLVSAIKYHCYARELPRGPLKNPRFFYASICDVIDHLCHFVETETQDDMARRVGCVCPAAPLDIKWLGLHAYKTILSRKSTLYAVLLKGLAAELRKALYRETSRRLANVVRPQWHAAILENLLY